MSDPKPWEVEPKLEMGRLLTLMDVFVQVRKELAPLYVKGDSPWSHGCRAYSWILDRFEQLEKDLRARGETWLRTKRNNNFFLMWIDEVLVRIYRGDPEKPNERALQIGQQLQTELVGVLGATGEDDASQWVWMLSYESSPMPWLAKDLQQHDGLVIAASVYQVRSAADHRSGAEIRNGWTKQVSAADTTLTALTENVARPYDSGRPSVKPRTTPKRKKDDAADGDRDV